MENPIKMDDLGVPLFLETPIFGSHSEQTNIENDGSSHGLGNPNLLSCFFGGVPHGVRSTLSWKRAFFAKVSHASVEIPPTIREKRIKAWFESWRVTPPDQRQLQHFFFGW